MGVGAGARGSGRVGASQKHDHGRKRQGGPEGSGLLRPWRPWRGPAHRESPVLGSKLPLQGSSLQLLAAGVPWAGACGVSLWSVWVPRGVPWKYRMKTDHLEGPS